MPSSIPLGLVDLLESWRNLPAAQQPEWPDPARVRAVADQLAKLPPLVFAGECDQLKSRLAAVARGEAFLLQGGDCAETFSGATADDVRNKLKTLLQMAVVLTYAASVPVVKIGRMAGQFAKPRSKPSEIRDGVRAPGVPRRHGQRLRLHRRGPRARPRAPAARLPRGRGHAEPLPGLHPGRLRRPAPGARLEPGLRGRQPRRAPLRAARRRDRPRAGVHERRRRRPRGVPPGRALLQPRGAAPRLRARADPDRLPLRPAVRRVGALPVDRRAHPPARRRARGVHAATSATRSASSSARPRPPRTPWP